MFEVTYGSSCFEGGSLVRKQFLMNALAIVKLLKGKNLILSSEANSVLLQRSPVDC